jgi:hypothetical protein
MLAAVDREKKSLVQIPTLVNFLKAGNLITCNHAIYALGLIALAYPDQQKMILNKLIGIGKNAFETLECREIAKGKVIETLGKLATTIKTDKKILEFIREAATSERNATANKAKKLAAKLSLSLHG